MTERWADIPDYPNYQVSDHGRVWSKRSNRSLEGYLDKQTNYRVFQMYNEDGHKTTQLAVLLLKAFVRLPVGDETADHKDRNRQNNSLENLRWATKSEQNSNQVRNGQYHKHIYLKRRRDKKGDMTRSNWVVNIKIPDKNYEKQFSTKIWTYEQVLEHRNEVYASLGIEPVD